MKKFFIIIAIIFVLLLVAVCVFSFIAYNENFGVRAETYELSMFRVSDLWVYPIVLFGHSWGGFCVGSVFNFQSDVKAVISVSGFNRVTDLYDEYYAKLKADFLHKHLDRKNGLVGLTKNSLMIF